MPRGITFTPIVPYEDEKVLRVKALRRAEPEVGFADIKRLTNHRIDREDLRRKGISFTK